VYLEVYSLLFLEGRQSQQLQAENNNQRLEAARNLQKHPKNVIKTLFFSSSEFKITLLTEASAEYIILLHVKQMKCVH
jgi:hypothetical protein